jgi:uncharacterized protein (DUF1778 family)
MPKRRQQSDTQDATQQTARLQVRISAEDKAIIKRAAALRGCSLSAFVATSAVAAAEDVIRRGETIVLSERDGIKFVDAILNPKGPNEALLEAARRHREMFGRE